MYKSEHLELRSGPFHRRNTVERTAPRPKCRHIYYGDVHVGTIAERVGNPHDTDPQGWNCGFYPGSRPGISRTYPRPLRRPVPISGARGKCSCQSEPRPTFRRWREQRDWTAPKYALWDAGELRLTAAAVAEPISQSPNSAGGRKYGASEKSGALLFVKEPLPIPCLNSRSFGLLGVGDALELEPVDRADT